MTHPFSGRPVPDVTSPVPPGTARATIPFDGGDPRAGEALVELRDLGLAGDNYYARTDGSNPPYHQPLDGAIAGLFLREGAAKRLVSADLSLRAHGLRFHIFDGWRPVATQVGLWRFFAERFARDEPGLSAAEIDAKTALFVSDPRRFDRADPATWPLHATGGAVDLTLATLDGQLLDLGTGFDDDSERAATFHFEAALRRGAVAADDPRLMARRILYWTMRDAGFTNYLHEWWHYDLGDQMHVLTLKLLGEAAPAAAWYGYVEPRGMDGRRVA